MGDAADGPVVHLFRGPYVTCGGRRYEVPRGSKRLLAFVALRHARIERPYAAGVLWPFVDDARAAGNLRSALWRLRQAGIDVIVADKWSLALSDGVRVDVHAMAEWANRVIHGNAHDDDLELGRLREDALALLPGWYDEWAVVERERVRQRALHAMEALSRQLTACGRHQEAIEVATVATGVEPLRETAQRVLLEALLAEGNRAEADRAFVAFRALLTVELGVEPSHDLFALMMAESAAPAYANSDAARAVAAPRSA